MYNNNNNIVYYVGTCYFKHHTKKYCWNEILTVGYLYVIIHAKIEYNRPSLSRSFCMSNCFFSFDHSVLDLRVKLFLYVEVII